jgi:hypothetical protein
VVDSKYGSLWGGWCSLEPTAVFGLRVWKNIRKGWDSFSRFTRFVVGDGSKISFWHDLWCRDTALKVAFPALFGIACVKYATVADNLEFLGNSSQWNVSFIREAHDWEVDVFVSFFQVLHSVKVSRGSEDKLWWVSKKCLFKVKSFFYSLACSGSSRFPWKSVWRTKAQSRAAFFVWSATLGKILTLDNLRKRYVIVINRCYMSKKIGSPWIISFFTAM